MEESPAVYLQLLQSREAALLRPGCATKLRSQIPLAAKRTRGAGNSWAPHCLSAFWSGLVISGALCGACQNLRRAGLFAKQDGCLIFAVQVPTRWSASVWKRRRVLSSPGNLEPLAAPVGGMAEAAPPKSCFQRRKPSTCADVLPSKFRCVCLGFFLPGSCGRFISKEDDTAARPLPHITLVSGRTFPWSQKKKGSLTALQLQRAACWQGLPSPHGSQQTTSCSHREASSPCD